MPLNNSDKSSKPYRGVIPPSSTIPFPIALAIGGEEYVNTATGVNYTLSKLLNNTFSWSPDNMLVSLAKNAGDAQTVSANGQGSASISPFSVKNIDNASLYNNTASPPATAYALTMPSAGSSNNLLQIEGQLNFSLNSTAADFYTGGIFVVLFAGTSTQAFKENLAFMPSVYLGNGITKLTINIPKKTIFSLANNSIVSIRLYRTFASTSGTATVVVSVDLTLPNYLEMKIL